MQPGGSMQPLFNSFSHQIQSNASTAPAPQQVMSSQQILASNMLALQPQIPYHLGNMGPPLIPQSNPLVFPQNNVMGVGHMFPVNGQFGNLQSQAHIFPPQTSINPQLCLPFFGNPQFGFGQQQLQANSSMPLNSGPSQQQHQSWSHSQGNSVKYNQGNVSNTNGKNVSGKNFSRNPKRGFQNSQFHHGNSGQRKFGFHNEQHNTKGYGNKRAAKFGQANHTNPPKEKKRSLALTYTEQEIQQWREERRRNYPSKDNNEKKLAGKQSSSKVIDREAKIRREQLKEILAKQAELGVEVAEIPSHYLSDSEQQGSGRKENTRPLTKRGKFQNKHNKRGRYNRTDPATKKQKLLEKGSSKPTSSDQRKPTLLQKLLSRDIRRDKSSLLQVFRFMVRNSFFKDWPKQPLKFPPVIVKESGVVEEVVEDKALIVGKNVSEESSRVMAGNCDYVDNDNKNDNVEMKNEDIKGFDDDGDDDDDDDDNVKGSIRDEDTRTEEEEGEIID